MADLRIRISREQAHRLVEVFVAPELRPERHRMVDALFDEEERQYMLDICGTIAGHDERVEV